MDPVDGMAPAEVADSRGITAIEDAIAEVEGRIVPCRLLVSNGVDLGDALETFAVALGRYKRRLIDQKFSEVEASRYVGEFATAGHYRVLDANNRLWFGIKGTE